MKKLLIGSLIATSLVMGLNASDARDTTVNFYAVSAKTDANQGSHNGLGVMFDSEAVKVKLEKTSDFIKAGAVLKFNPVSEKWYVKVGANAINQKMYAIDNSTAKVNQYSGALAVGYMVNNDLYVEIGSSLTKLHGKTLGLDYEIVDETTKIAYFEIAKRWNGSFGVLDTTANAGRVIHEFSNNENSYGVGLDYYPVTDTKLGYKYQNEKNSISNNYSVHYSYLFLEYTDNISNDTYQVNGGVKFTFTDPFDFSTYKAPKNIIPHLSELHRFEDISFSNNMELKSNAGVQLTPEAVKRIEAEKKASLDAEEVVEDCDEIAELLGLCGNDTDLISKEPEKFLDIESPILSSGNESFTTTVGTALTLINVVGKDNIDKEVEVVQDGTVDFNTVGKYEVKYYAKDVAGNSVTIIHTYLVEGLLDSPSTITPPTLSSKTTSSVYTVVGSLTDTDGVKNVTVKGYLGSTLIGTKSSGGFTGLSSGTTYTFVTTGEALNATTGLYEQKTSTALTVTTNTPAPEPEPEAPAPTPQESCEAGGGFWDGTQCQ